MEFLDAWDNSDDVKALPEDVAAEANGEVEILRAQANASTPREVLAQPLHSLRTILEGGGGLLAGTGVLEMSTRRSRHAAHGEAPDHAADLSCRWSPAGWRTLRGMSA